ncbi:MAG: hypothetical protein ABI723_15810 [Bacteroidia bacterium]
MKKNLLGIVTILFLSHNFATAQSWNLGGNAPTATSVLGNTTNQNLNIITNNATRITVKKSGQVGIGITNPTSTLQVQKSGLTDVLVKSTGDGAQLTIDRAANGFEAITRYTQTGVPQWKTGLTVNATGSPDYVINNQIMGSDAMTIGGTTNKITIHSGSMTFGNTNSCDMFQTGNDMNIKPFAPLTFFGLTPGNLILCTKTTGILESVGNVGIGTNDPSRAKLVVSGNVGKTNAIFGQGSTGISLVQNWPSIGFNSYYASTGWKSMQPGYGFQMSFDPAAGYLSFFTSSNATAADQFVTQTVPFIIHATGAVGINNSSAISTLDVTLKAGTSAAASFWGTSTGFASHFCQGVNEDTYIRGGLSTSNVIIADINNQRVAIGGGQVANGYKLSVNGKVICTELRVAAQGSWPDFVFKKDYQLTSISDLKKSIEANGHLPGIPSACEVENNGIAVGEMQNKMMQKIEELTLYIIQLKEENDVIKSKLSSLGK